VDMVFAALCDAQPGEIYLPNVGGNMREIIVRGEEIRHCAQRGRYYAIKSMLPEVRAEIEPNTLERDFGSANDVLPYSETLQLLQSHMLMIEDARPEECELSR